MKYFPNMNTKVLKVPSILDTQPDYLTNKIK